VTNSDSTAIAPVVIDRVFDAPRELVFKAWSEPERLEQWWGPKGMPITCASLDFRPGGVFHYSMAVPNAEPWWGKFTYREIEAPSRIVFVNSFSDAGGGVTRHPLSATWPLEVLNTLTLTDQDGRTRLHLHGTPLNATDEERATFGAAQAGVQTGFNATFDQLAGYLASA
jgi:uncharacterized protein YndB with AHSA1/START domain